MGDTILLFESRDLCYESNRYFMERLLEELSAAGARTELCDLSGGHMGEKLEEILGRKQEFRAALDFNSLLPRAELEDGTPYLDALGIPFFNYLVDHPLYHHPALDRPVQQYYVICIDRYHQAYVRTYYPNVKNVYYLPLGAMQANFARSFDQKRFELLFLGTYTPTEQLYEEINERPERQKKEIKQLIAYMEAEEDLTQESALERYLGKQEISKSEFARRLNEDYLADKYLRNQKRRTIVNWAAKSGVPFTLIGHGWEQVPELVQTNAQLKEGIGFNASVQMIADAKILLNATPGFHGGMHDRVYSSMLNHTVCLTEESRFAKEHFQDGKELVLFDAGKQDSFLQRLYSLYEHPERSEEISGNAWKRAIKCDTWGKRAEEVLRILESLD